MVNNETLGCLGSVMRQGLKRGHKPSGLVIVVVLMQNRNGLVKARSTAESESEAMSVCKDSGCEELYLAADSNQLSSMCVL